MKDVKYSSVTALQECDVRQLGGDDAVDDAWSTVRSSRTGEGRPSFSNVWTCLGRSLLRLVQLSLRFLGKCTFYLSPNISGLHVGCVSTESALSTEHECRCQMASHSFKDFCTVHECDVLRRTDGQTDALYTVASGVAGPLAARGGGQICRPFVLGF